MATVVSGTWYIGYGDAFNAASLKALPAGSFYTEPSNRSHFAETRDEPVTVQYHGRGAVLNKLYRPSLGPKAQLWEIGAGVSFPHGIFGRGHLRGRDR